MQRLPLPALAETQHTLRRLTKDSAMYAAAKLAPAIAGLVTLLVATRVLQASEYGEYTIVLSTSVVLVSSLFGWLRQSMLRFLPSLSANTVSTLYMEGVNGLLVVTVCVAAVMGVTVLSVQQLDVASIIVGSVLVSSTLLFRYVETILQAFLLSQRAVVLSIVSAMLQLVCLTFVFIPWLGATKSLLLATSASYAFAAAAILSVRPPRVVTLRAAKPAWEVTKRFALYGMPMTGWFFATQAQNLGDRYVIRYFHGSAAVGSYSAPYDLANTAFSLLTMPVLIAMQPIVMRVWERTHDPVTTGNVLRLGVSIYVASTVPVALFGSLFSQDIIQAVLGGRFSGGHAVFGIVGFGMLFAGLANYAHKGLEIAGRTMTMFRLSALAALLNLALNVLLVPTFGYRAAAFTTVVSNAVYLIIAFSLADRYVLWRLPWNLFSRIAVAAVAAALAALGGARIFGQPDDLVRLFALVSGFLVVYCFGLVSTGVIRPDDVINQWKARNDED